MHDERMAGRKKASIHQIWSLFWMRPESLAKLNFQQLSGSEGIPMKKSFSQHLTGCFETSPNDLMSAVSVPGSTPIARVPYGRKSFGLKSFLKR